MHSTVRKSLQLAIILSFLSPALHAACNLTCLANVGTTFADCQLVTIDEYWSCVDDKDGPGVAACYKQRQSDLTTCNNNYDVAQAKCGCTGDCPAPPNIMCSGTAETVCVNGSQWVCSDGSTPCKFPAPGFDCVCISGVWINCEVSPIVIDTKGEGFQLTDADHGVRFRFVPLTPSVKVSWTDSKFSNGWLALDRNGNGRIDDGTELFGNATPQPRGDDPNGYAALAVFDDPSNGGNGDGLIDARDAIYEHLRVWIDKNHNGISEPGELYRLPDVGVFRISLAYTRSDFVDKFGNQFRYRSKIWDIAGREHDACYDVFLQVASETQ
jgi:hypothetical protein